MSLVFMGKGGRRVNPFRSLVLLPMRGYRHGKLLSNISSRFYETELPNRLSGPVRRDLGQTLQRYRQEGSRGLSQFLNGF